MEYPKCFGTKEYSNTNGICRRCRYYKECAVVDNKKDGTVNSKKQYYFCIKCRSKDIEWFILGKDFDKHKHYIGKCNNCGHNIILAERSRRI